MPGVRASNHKPVGQLTGPPLTSLASQAPASLSSWPLFQHKKRDGRMGWDGGGWRWGSWAPGSPMITDSDIFLYPHLALPLPFSGFIFLHP
jgi:hypothetical protein